MGSRRSQERKIKEIAKRLADSSESAKSAQRLKRLLDNLAEGSDFESLPEIGLFIRDHFETGALEEDQGAQTTLEKLKSNSLVKVWAEYTTIQKGAIVGSLSVVLIMVVFALTSLLGSSNDSRKLSSSPGAQPPTVEQTAGVIGKTEVPTQPARVGATPTQVTSTGAAPIDATPTGATPTPSPSPALSKKEYAILACVSWRDDQAVGLPGSLIAWQIDQAEPSREEINVLHENGCVKFPVFALPHTKIRLMASLPQDASNLQIVGHAEKVGSQPVAWEIVEGEGAFALTTTLGEETSTEYTARFLVVARRTFSGSVVAENRAGISGAEVGLWGRASSESDWEPINKTTTADPDGTFVLTDTTGSPQVFYRVGVTNTVTNRYVYAKTSASGPSNIWVDREDPQMPFVSFIETQAAPGSDQLTVQDILFNQKLEHVLLSVQDAILEPGGLEWQTVSASSGQDEIVSKLITIDQANVDTLQARWENIELPPGTYALEIWTPENTSARVNYLVLSSGQLLDNRVSYQSTRQDRGQVNQWIDFSATLNPSLVIELTASELVTVIAKPSSRKENRDFNLSGNVLFGVGPVRFVKQQ